MGNKKVLEEFDDKFVRKEPEGILENCIYNADCLDLMPHIKSKSIDMILCDLPYGTTACKWDTIIPFEPLWEQYKRIIKDNGAIVLTASQPFTSALVMSNIKMFKYEIIWEKEKPTNFLLVKKQIAKQHENILVFYNSQPIYNPQMYKCEDKYFDKRKTYNNSKQKQDSFIGVTTLQCKRRKEDGLRYPKSVYKVSRERKSLHPTQKPVALFEYLIKTYTNEGDVVLDNCAGSFTTAIASENLKRNWICIEKEAEYCAIGEKRIKENRERLLNKETQPVLL
jgi:site-specific DNA-methyltransferase (adenine-specific)